MEKQDISWDHLDVSSCGWAYRLGGPQEGPMSDFLVSRAGPEALKSQT